MHEFVISVSGHDTTGVFDQELHFKKRDVAVATFGAMVAKLAFSDDHGIKHISLTEGYACLDEVFFAKPQF